MAPSSVSEDAAATTVTVTAALDGGRRGPGTRLVTVQVGAAGDSAVEGTDYAAVADLEVTIRRGRLPAGRGRSR